MKYEITETHLLFVTIYGLVWSSSVTLKHKMMLVHSQCVIGYETSTLSSNDKAEPTFSKSQEATETLLAMIALSAVQSSTGTRIHNAILCIDISTMLNTAMVIFYPERHV